MGIRIATVRMLGVADLTTTVLTLGIAGLAGDSSLAGGANPGWRRRIGSVVTMFAGAALGAWLLRTSLAWALGISGVASGACALAIWFTAGFSESVRRPGVSVAKLDGEQSK